MEQFLAGAEVLLSHFWIIPLGVLIGMIIGCAPGLSPPNTLAALIPLIVTIPPITGLLLCICLYVGAEMSASFPAVTLNIPGHGSATITALEGYPLRLRGHAARALGICVMGATVGTMMGGLASITLAPLISLIAVKFSDVEFSITILFALVVIAQISAGGVAKGLLAGFFGLTLATTGVDPLWGEIRGTFGITYLYNGFSQIAVLVGLLGFSELYLIIERNSRPTAMVTGGASVTSEIIEGFRIVLHRPLQCLRAGLIAIGIGLIPGAGASAAAFVAYQQARAFASPQSKRYFGKGSYDGLVAVDIAHNSMIGGSLVPLLTLGLPGSATMVVVLVIMQYHGLEVGPRLFQLHPDLTYALLLSQFFAAPFILIFGTMITFVAHRITYVSSNIIVPIVGVFCMIGAFALHQYLFDIWIMLIASVVGYCMKKYEYPPLALLIGLLLGHYFEGDLFRALQMGFGSPAIFFERPIALALWGFLFVVLAGPPLILLISRVPKTTKDDHANT